MTYRIPSFCRQALTGGIALALSPLVLAQQAPGSQGQLEEVIVTAEKRESSVQTTPISLTAVSGTDIAERGVTDLASLVQSVPGVTLRTSGPGMAEFEMRGVSSTGGNSPTVGFYYDDTPLTAPAATNEGKIVISPALYDLARVEVLRGPQGTLYGSGSMGGTIKVVPNPPNTAAFAASAETTFGGTQGGGFNHAENGMLNLPFGNGLAALRFVASYSHDSGWIDRIVTAPGQFPAPNGTTRGDVAAAPVARDYRNVNDVGRVQARVSLLVKPLEGLEITPTVFYQRMTAGGLPYIDSPPATDAHYQPYDVAERYRDEFKLLSLNVRYRTDAFEVSSTTAYWNRHEPLTQDTTESWATGLSPAVATPVGDLITALGPSYAYENNKSHQTTEELRVQSAGDRRVDWLLGYFYQDFESFWDIDFPSATGASVFGSNDLFYYFNPNKIIQQSFFGEATWHVTQAFGITAGARRYHYDAPVSVFQTGALTGGASTNSTIQTDQGVTPKLSASYQVNPDLLVFATAAKGFRPGGGTGPVPTAGSISCEADLQRETGSTGFVAGPISFNSDHVWSYEFGEKFRTEDRRLSVNASAYFLSWIGVQQTNALPTCGYIYTANAGNAHVYGGELEIQAAVTQELTLSASTAYTHSALVSSAFADAPAFNPGTPIQDVAKWTASAFVVYRHPLNDRLTLTGRIDDTFVGSRNDQTYAINTLPSYDLANARLGVEGDRWSAFAFVNNVADKRALLTDITQDAQNVPTWNRIAVSQPRTFGVDLNYRFAP